MRAYHPRWTEASLTGKMEWRSPRGSTPDARRTCGHTRERKINSAPPVRRVQPSRTSPSIRLVYDSASLPSPLTSQPLKLTTTKFDPHDMDKLQASIAADKACITTGHRQFIPMLMEKMESMLPLEVTDSDSCRDRALEMPVKPRVASCSPSIWPHKPMSASVVLPSGAYGRYGYVRAQDHSPLCRGFKGFSKPQSTPSPPSQQLHGAVPDLLLTSSPWALPDPACLWPDAGWRPGSAPSPSQGPARSPRARPSAPATTTTELMPAAKHSSSRHHSAPLPPPSHLRWQHSFSPAPYDRRTTTSPRSTSSSANTSASPLQFYILGSSATQLVTREAEPQEAKPADQLIRPAAAIAAGPSTATPAPRSQAYSTSTAGARSEACAEAGYTWASSEWALGGGERQGGRCRGERLAIGRKGCDPVGGKGGQGNGRLTSPTRHGSPLEGWSDQDGGELDGGEGSLTKYAESLHSPDIPRHHRQQLSVAGVQLSLPQPTLPKFAPCYSPPLSPRNHWPRTDRASNDTHNDILKKKKQLQSNFNRLKTSSIPHIPNHAWNPT